MRFYCYGQYWNLQIILGQYSTTNNIAIQLTDYDEGPFATLTVNIIELPKGEACIDVNNFPEGERLIKKFDLGVKTGRTVQSGYCTYPVYKLNMDNILKYTE